MTRLIANNFSTTLNGAITNVATSMTLTSVTGFPAVGGGDTCQVTLDDGAGNIEIVTATAISGSVVTITRAQEGTTGFAFADLDPVEVRDTALLYTDVLASDETPQLQGPLDTNSNYIGLWAGATGSLRCLTAVGAHPQLIGSTGMMFTFSSSGPHMQHTNTNNKFTITSNGPTWVNTGVTYFSVTTSGLQLNSGARVTTILDEDTMSSDSATALATQQSIKAYVDAAGGGLANVVDDTTPQLGGALDVNGSQITSVSAGDIELHSDNDVNIILGDAAGADDFNIKDSAAAIVASINSDGDADFTSLTLDTVLAVAEGGTGVDTRPAFLASCTGNTSVNSSTFTKIAFDSELLDTNSDYDPTTNYRFTPSVAGSYICYVFVYLNDSGTAAQYSDSLVYKNGGQFIRTINKVVATGGDDTALIMGVVEMNGTTDYLEGYAWQDSGGALNYGSSISKFGAIWVGP